MLSCCYVLVWLVTEARMTGVAALIEIINKFKNNVFMYL